MTDDFFVTPDLGVASRLQVLGFQPEVAPQEGSPRALFRFRRTQQFTQALSGLANGTIPENTEEVARARGTLRTRAIFAVESARSRS